MGRKKTTRRKAKNKPGRPPAGRGISIEKYEAICAAWAEKQTLGYVAKIVGVCEPTVKKYVFRGDPARDLEPADARLQRILREARVESDAKAKGDAIEMMDLVRQGKRVLRHALRKHLGELENVAREDYGGDVFKALKDVHSVESALTGRPGEILGLAEMVDPLADMDDAEVLEFLREALPALERAGFGADPETWVPPCGPVDDVARVLH